MAPIFDSGNSMFCQNPLQPLSGDLTEIEVNSFKANESALLKYVYHANLVDGSKLPSPEELQNIYAKDPLITYTETILLGYQKKIDALNHLGFL